MVWICQKKSIKVSLRVITPSYNHAVTNESTFEKVCHFGGERGGHAHGLGAAHHLAGRQGDEGADALAAGHQRVAHGLVHRRRLAVVRPLAREHVHALRQSGLNRRQRLRKVLLDVKRRRCCHHTQRRRRNGALPRHASQDGMRLGAYGLQEETVRERAGAKEEGETGGIEETYGCVCGAGCRGRTRNAPAF
jgi:hypothetical protein